MIKLKDLLFENEAPNIFIPRRIEDRAIKYNQMTQKSVNKIIDNYNAKKNKGDIDLSVPSLDYDYDPDYDFNTSELSLTGEFIIPDTLKKVGSGLSLENSNVTKLPDNLTIGDYINDYSNSKLDISYCKRLKTLPKGLKVARIYAYNNGLIEIPDDVQCIYLDLQYTRVKQLPLFKNFIKEIDLDGCRYFKTLPVGFTAGQVLIQGSKSFVSVPNNVNIKKLIVNECEKFTSIGSNCTIERLFIGYSCPNFITLPTDIKADLLNLTYINTPLRIQLFNKYKTKPKVLKALKIMYPNVKEFQLGYQVGQLG
jgi:hypothetical protein